MSTLRRAALGLLASVTVALSACGSDGDTGGDAAGEDEAAPRVEAAPGGGDGAALYAASCASCHGSDLRGSPVGPSQLSVVYEPSHHSDDTYRAAIRSGAPAHHWGFGPMPAFPGLDDGQITQIISFIRSVQEREGFEP